MAVNEIIAKSLLRKHKKIDSWFVSRYGMNLYRGCVHDCAYCDGRAEGYYVDGDFGSDVDVKINAPELLEKELNPARKRVPLKKGFILPGGGVGDSYQAVEKKYALTKKILGIIERYNFPVHILTKSTLVERDFDILESINKQTRSFVSFSFSSTNDEISKVFEPGVPAPTKRLETISKLSQLGIATGVYLMPVIPFITDLPEILDKSFRDIKEAGAQYIVFGGMTLKDGRQKDFFYQKIKDHYPELVSNYDIIYPGNKWGSAIGEYYSQLNTQIMQLSKKYQVPSRIPAKLYNKVIDQNDLVAVILEQMDYILKQKGEKSPYGYGAWSVSQLKEPISEHRTKLKQLNGIGPVTERIILEILDSGTSKYYEKLINN